jgi:zinc protease
MITRFEVDGVPALFAEASGQTRAGLVFRVGLADEPLPRRGITHLLEHLALHTAGVADYHYNGATMVEHTIFLMQGSAADIVKFFDGVCSSLREPPIQRLAVEKEILRTEASSRRGGANDQLPMWRHGARDYGVSSYPEWGLSGLTEADLRAWAAHYFVRQNAVLWIAGPQIPDGLRLNLLDGQRRPTPAPSSAVPVLPAYFHGPSGGVLWDTVVAPEPAAAIFADVLEREMLRALRQEGGLSYTVTTDYEPRQNGTAVITALADSLPDKGGAVLGGMVDVLARVRLGRLDDSDLTAVVNHRLESLTQAEQQGMRVPGQAYNLLAGRPVQTLDEALAETRAVTMADVSRVAAHAYANGLLQTPGRSTADWAGYTAAPIFSEHQVVGQAYPSLEDPAGARVVLGEEGATVIDGESVATVRFAECLVMLAWPDGARQLIGPDAIAVRLEPTLHHGLPAAIPAVDARIPPHLRVLMPARSAGQIPVPQPRPVAAKAPAGRFAAPDDRRGLILNLAIFAPVALITGFVAIGIAAGWIEGGEGLAGSPGALAVGCGLSILWTARTIRALRRLNAR